MRLLRRVVVYLTIVAVAVSLAIGFWPVHANVFGNPSYDCGSGFVHNNGNRYNIDSASLKDQRTATDTATGTPSQLCPDKVHNRRDLALWVGITGIVWGGLGLAFTSGPRDRVSRAMFGAMRAHPGGD